MFTIKFAAAAVGVPEATLRTDFTWERRYGVVAPKRSEGGYRIYDRAALARLSAMRRLVGAGWSPARAAAAIRNGDVPVDGPSPGQAAEFAPNAGTVSTYRREFLNAAARLDAQGLDISLDRGMALGSFEHAVDGWLMPTLVALGEGWASGEVDVAAEHGVIGGRPVACASAGTQVAMHQGYELPQAHQRNVDLLRRLA